MVPQVDLLGGRYEARLNADGTLDVFDVPILSELQKGEREDLPEFSIDSTWLAAALKQAAVRASEGYMAPLHIRHHGTDKIAARAGFFVPRRIAEFQVDGKVAQTLFADLVRVNPDAAQRILKGELPYRSVEILNTKGAPEIDSLALLDSEPPQFRYPLLSIGKLVRMTNAHVRPLAAQTGPAVAYQAFPAHSAATALFRFPRSGGIKMAAPTEDEKLKAAADKEAEEKLAADKKDEEKLKAAADEKDEEKLAAAADGHPEPDGDEMPPWADKFLSKLVAALKPAERPAEQLAAAPPEADTALATAATPSFVDPTLEGADKLAAKAISRLSAKFTAEMAGARGEIAGLKAALAQRARKDTEADLLAAAKKDLLESGIELDPATLDEDLPATAKLGKEALDRFVASLKRLAPRDPVQTFAALSADASNDPPEVARFQLKGVGQLTMARRLAANYEENRKKGVVTMSLERYLACNASLIESAA